MTKNNCKKVQAEKIELKKELEKIKSEFLFVKGESKILKLKLQKLNSSLVGAKLYKAQQKRIIQDLENQVNIISSQKSEIEISYKKFIPELEKMKIERKVYFNRALKAETELIILEESIDNLSKLREIFELVTEFVGCKATVKLDLQLQISKKIEESKFFIERIPNTENKIKKYISSQNSLNLQKFKNILQNFLTTMSELVAVAAGEVGDSRFDQYFITKQESFKEEN